MWFIVKILWTNYMWFIVRILWTWNLFFTLLEISKPLFFFFSIFGNAIITIAKKKKNYSPISAMTLLSLLFFILRALHTRAHSDAQDWENWAVEFRQCHCRNSKIFSLLFLHSLSYFLAEFRQCHCRNSVSLLKFPIIFEQLV